VRITVAIGGNRLVQNLLERGELRIDEADLIYAGERQKTRIIERTLRGRDYLDKPFKPYSEKGPYYYYPQSKGYKGERQAITKAINYRVGGGTPTKSGLGIKYESYGAFKRALGRTNVDLFGPRAPHMLQAMVVQVQPSKIVIGIWGDEAARADGHNTGTRTLPQRRFLDVSPQDLVLMGNDIADSMAKRLSIAVPDVVR
jgi:hypothetical protein